MVTLVLDKEYCAKQKLNRYQLVIETIGLYTYMLATITELLVFNSFYMLVYHMFPLMLYQGCVVASAAFAHSGVDKRNSFDSNGLFDPYTLPPKQALFGVSMKVIGIIGNWAVLNHGIHHAFTQLPLEIVNADYKFINQHCLDTKYKHIRYNNVLVQRVAGHLYDRIPMPKWYDYIIQAIVAIIAVIGYAGTVVGLPVIPSSFESILVDYRLLFYSTKAERAAAYQNMWDGLNLTEFKKKIVRPNAYLEVVSNNYEIAKKNVIEAEAEGQKITYPNKFEVPQEILTTLWKTGTKPIKVE